MLVYRNKYENAIDILFFLKTLLIIYITHVFELLFRLTPNNFFEIPALWIKSCRIETEDCYSSSEEEEDIQNNNREIMETETKMLSFMLSIDLNKLNKYKTSDGKGLYNIKTAIVFRNNRNRVCNIISINNKLTVWMRLFSNGKMFINDILNMANVYSINQMDTKLMNYYLFMIVEEIETGYSHKILANLTTKKYIPDYSDIMFSKVCIRM